MIEIPIVIGLIILACIVVGVVVMNLIEICQPNEVLVFSGLGLGDEGYQIIHSGRKVRLPLFHTVDRMDVTNIVIDVNVTNAYSRGFIALSVKGVANVKIGSHGEYVNNAVEKLMGMPRSFVQQLAKETLEGNLRGVLATLTPEEVNDDRQKFETLLTEEATEDLLKLGLVLDNLNIQSVTDDSSYLDSIGRAQSAKLIMNSRVAEATNRAEATEQDAQNQLDKAIAKIDAQKDIAKAEAARRVTDAQTKGRAMVAEERSKAGSAIARARAGLDVQRARLEQVKRQLAADVIQPAQARKSELEAQAKADAASLIEDGKATAEALRSLVQTWKDSGDSARSIFMVQQFDTILEGMLSTIQDIKIDKITVIDSKMQDIDRGGSGPMKAASGAEQIRQTLGLDLPRVLQGLAGATESS